jgi:iron complex transport system substrate-binding protein
MGKKLRIITLTPSATEIVFFLGLEGLLVGKSEDSDEPLKAGKIRIIKNTKQRNSYSSEIEKAIEMTAHQGISVNHIDQRQLSALKPDLVISAETCRACAPKESSKIKAASVFRLKCPVLSLEPKTFEDVFINIETVAEFCEAKEHSRPHLERLNFRLSSIPPKHKNLRKPTAVILRSLNPLITHGYWTNEMVKIAGGELLLSKKGERGGYVDWYEIITANPDVIIFSPDDLTVEQVSKVMYTFKYRSGWDKLSAVKKGQIYFLPSKYVSRPGPMLIWGTEILAKIFHPLWFGYPAKNESRLLTA